MQKKKLDELFQDKLSDFKPTPDNKVWRAIDASLEKKRKKRIIPIWWKLGSIAATLVIGLLLFNPFTENEPSNETLVDTLKQSKTNNEAKPTSRKETFIDSLNKDNTQIVEQATEEANHDINVVSAKTKNSNKVIQFANKKINTNRSKNNNVLTTNETNTQKSNTNSNNLIAENNAAKKLDNDIQNKAALAKDGLDNSKLETSKITLENNIANKNSGISSQVAINELNDENIEIVEVGKKSIFEEIPDKEEKKQDVASKRWSAGPNVAPVYFNGHGKGSPVNSIFTPNSKSGNINFSYGVSVAYAVSKKLTIRSGINKVDYGYDTEDVAFSSSINALSSNGQLKSIDYAPTSETLTVSSKKVASENFSTTNSALDVTAKSATRDGYMSQQFGYLELPIEVNYALIDKKFGVNIIGGVSSLFLIDNAVSLTAGELTTEIGEANNINDLNFSANMGLGFNYKFSPKISFNLEPIFKYQLNTFSEVDGTFLPYSIGVYSGLSFKF
ncbi:Outer membrane protein beta-barrel domain-containing protein [Maribacter orientalis]|uniref:Outer membrane protein beta-barrel domain-containing protein n=1 Tax=Maribacter orientalis TaxID=228957 RepID=A0A1H7TN56_9FLAO|nr:outer membrane beta-barrel protein [Maribacter orientalis]SEL85796.1 Outer membrane protein beta-barrel domain-containing protein [Maribacter orientalis]